MSSHVLASAIPSHAQLKRSHSFSFAGSNTQLDFHDFIYHKLEVVMNGNGVVDFRFFKSGVMEIGMTNLDDSAYLRLYQHIDNLNQGKILINDITNFIETSCTQYEVENLRRVLYDLLQQEYAEYQSGGRGLLSDQSVTSGPSFLVEAQSVVKEVQAALPVQRPPSASPSLETSVTTSVPATMTSH